MPNVVLLVHGMGKHGDNWSTEGTTGGVQGRIKSLAATVKAGRNTPFALSVGAAADGEVILREIRYDQYFDEELNRTGRNADELIKFGDAAGVSLPVKGLLSWLQTEEDDTRDFFWSHVCDVLLFRTFPHVRKRVTEMVARQIAEHVDAVRQTAVGATNVSILAHSLGTAVTEATLHRMATLQIGGSTVMQPPNFRFQSVGMVANVSRILADGDVYQSIVRSPLTGGGPSYYVRSYLTFRHALDPFTMLKPFDAPREWDRKYYVQPEDLAHHLLFNVHDYEHYLVHPAVHLNLFNAWWNAAITPRAEILAAVTSYAPASPTACTQEMLEMHDALVEIRDDVRRHQNASLAWLKGITRAGVLATRLVGKCADGGTLP